MKKTIIKKRCERKKEEIARNLYPRGKHYKNKVIKSHVGGW